MRVVPEDPFLNRARAFVPAKQVLVLGPGSDVSPEKGVFGKNGGNDAKVHYGATAAGAPSVVDLEVALASIQRTLQVHGALLFNLLGDLIMQGARLRAIPNTRKLGVTSGSMLVIPSPTEMVLNPVVMPIAAEKPLRFSVLVRDELVSDSETDIPTDLAEGPLDEGDEGLVKIRTTYRRDLLTFNKQVGSWVLLLGHRSDARRLIDAREVEAPSVPENLRGSLVPFATVLTKPANKTITEIVPVAFRRVVE